MKAAIEAAWLAITEVIPDPDSVVAATARGLMFGYNQRWAESGWLCEANEQTFELPIINPDTGRASRTFAQAGKMDKIGFHSGKQWLVEHKTTSEDLADPNSPYFRRLEIDHQVSQYMLASWQQGQKLEGTLYDCIRKPGIRPKQVAKAGRIETAEEFQDRLCQDTIDRPDFYFARRTIYRTDSQILDFAREWWETADEVRLARAAGRHYKNPGACMLYNHPCEYLGICSGHDTPDSSHWSRAEKVHTELDIDGDGRNVLTNSRVACFKTCRRKHELRYEIGIRRTDKEESEALYFGTIFHHALSAWWAHFPSENSNGNGTSSPANEAGEPCAATTADDPGIDNQ